MCVRGGVRVCVCMHMHVHVHVRMCMRTPTVHPFPAGVLLLRHPANYCRPSDTHRYTSTHTRDAGAQSAASGIGTAASRARCRERFCRRSRRPIWVPRPREPSPRCVPRGSLSEGPRRRSPLGQLIAHGARAVSHGRDQACSSTNIAVGTGVAVIRRRVCVKVRVRF